MRRSLALLLVLGSTTACTRTLIQPYPAPVRHEPEPATRPVVLAGAPTKPGRNAVSEEEAVDYLLARGMEIPVAGRSVKDLEDTFDVGRDGGRTHRALDILAPRGTPVLAADSGRILRISENKLGGNTVYTTDPQERIVYYYAHLDAYQPGLVQGMAIARGDTLGFVGTTGNAPKDTPHLHFQVMRMPADGKYWDGEAINPYPLFLLEYAAHDTLVKGAR
jgi:murein DD-endopeptidase MepM/ murein hydrolase activator NlpD